LLCYALLLAGCGGSKRPAVQDLSGRENLSLFTLQSMRGARDGDRLRTLATFSDSSSILTVEMQFAIGSPTKLEAGAWRWSRNNQLRQGTVAARSVTFLGGQDGPPSIGGAFDLAGPEGAALYRIAIPVTELKRK
jgi:hypothetical protein